MRRGQREASVDDQDGRADSERQRRERKRAQNRRSQQCFRERQAARIQELTDMVEELKKQPNTSSNNDGQNRVDLLKENQELRQALLSMRKSLLSLSSAAAFSADSDVLKRILNKPGGHKIDNPDADSPQTEGTEDIPFAPLETNASKNQITTNVFQDPLPGNFEVTGDTAQAFDAFLNNDRFFEEMNLVASSRHTGNVGANKRNDPTGMNNPSSGFSADSLYNLISGHQGPIIESNFLHNMLAQPEVATPGPQAKGRTHGSSLITLEAVIEEVLSTMKFHAIRDRLEIPRTTLSLSPEEIELFDSHTRTGVTSLAVRAFLKSTHLGGYTRVMGFTGLVENIMQWRMAPTSENRAKIPPPFTPTVLQQRFTDHHPAIDFLTWGDLRDQLLLYVNLSCVDLNKLLYDSVRCVVREFHHLQVAVPVLDTVAYIATTHSAVSTKATAVTNEIYGPGYGLKDERLMETVVDRIHKHGFDKLEERKLSPTFGVAYPFLDISNTVTKMPVVDYRSIQSCF